MDTSLLPTFPDTSSPHLLCATVTAWAELVLASQKSTSLTECVSERYTILEHLWQRVLLEAATVELDADAQTGLHSGGETSQPLKLVS